MQFQKANITIESKTEKIYEDTMFLGNQIKKHTNFNDSLKKIALSRNVTPSSVRANVCLNLGLNASDWHDYEHHSVKATNKIAIALIRRYPEKRNEILEVFKSS